ncbi:YrzI family small protein [Bacillus aquiflavi]|uniref:YrzI family small protein n=1 Tax=Bacillus aquiflavi TaxID=2672567 RepID=A0A6B3W338_9BACI|nr:YrzI family small protein [Bacillus aquiflavi]MBA4538544.1 YrzI family small protein [Bacillus aquiflavi]NEY82907.1 YrzI family small protein [Bacillus aquiflavi]UAC47332.1 YrzI family small protein [Bacillus aquiflavi]
MTLHILFFTITIKRRKFTIDEMLREQEVNEIMEQHKDRQFSRYNHF